MSGGDVITSTWDLKGTVNGKPIDKSFDVFKDVYEHVNAFEADDAYYATSDKVAERALVDAQASILSSPTAKIADKARAATIILIKGARQEELQRIADAKSRRNKILIGVGVGAGVLLLLGIIYLATRRKGGSSDSRRHYDDD